MPPQLRLIADEGVEKWIVKTLRKNFDVVYIAEFLQGSDDEFILELARNQNRILITLDKDFGELVFRMAQVHAGVILCRFHGLSIEEKCDLVESTLLKYGTELLNSFTVIQSKTYESEKRNHERKNRSFPIR